MSPPLSRLVSSFGMPTAVREGFNYVADLTLPCGTKTFNVFFAMENFHLSIKVHRLSTIINSMNSHGYVVSPNFPRVRGGEIKIFGILGIDSIQLFNHFSLEKASMFGHYSTVIKVDNGFLPFGSGIHFMPPNEEQDYMEGLLGNSREKATLLICQNLKMKGFR